MGVLDGKAALVTGGGKGIGAAIAERLAHEGADVALTFNTSEHPAKQVVARIEAAGRTGAALQADMADPSAAGAVVDRAAATLGRIDILVNNAGVFPYGRIDELTLDDYEATTALHLRAVFIAVKRVLGHMPDGGRIVSIGSNLAEHVPGPGISLYSLSKSGLIGFTKGLARDLGPRGITANVVHPGSTDTDMNPADGEGAEEQRAQTALGRYGDATEIAAAVAHVAAPESGFVTGTAVTVDGGANS
ncbi:SDR family NAD(P)-dependent oxidoreductase [Streptomonospora salina]|uniref:NAD(P)-dependent dehydrogenase (Short-subunit alcohol dehydrogenase family) n=1 Tax=Streptomonospora salina TaxID=104205 RepID=A0A841ENR4_9ACTN|nr:SDR family oxidoreductase [Streptomonospora salina]MBB6001061.1 NAD(P)-dependent dehydrogenase (short-subunit alcohol dehydrogenase family) [Streptomonospora salina]